MSEVKNTTANVVPAANLSTSLESAKQQLAAMKSQLAALKEQEKAIKDAEKAMKEKEKAEAAKAEAEMFTHADTETVLNLRFTNGKLFKGSKYRTIEDKELIKKVLAFYVAELKKSESAK